MLEIDRVYASEVNRHHGLVVRCPENPHSSLRPCVSVIMPGKGYRFTDVTDNVAGQFPTEKLIDIRLLCLIICRLVMRFIIFCPSHYKCSTTSPFHAWPSHGIWSWRGRNFALQPLEQETRKLLSILLRIQFKVCVFLDECVVEFLGIQGLR